VVIPAFNAGGFLVEAVASVLAQTRPTVQIIVVDDGSTDGSVDAVAHLPVTILATGGGALAAGARNTGLKACSGEFVAFLDADDIWDIDHLATLLDLAARFPAADLFYSRIRRIGEYPGDADVWGPDRTPWNPTIALIQGNRIQPSATMVRRTALARLGEFRAEFPGVEDLDLWLRVARQAPFVGTHQVTVSYRVHPAQTIANKPRMRQSLWAALRAFARESAGTGDQETQAQVAEALRRRFRYDLYWAWREGDQASLHTLSECVRQLRLGPAAALRTRLVRMVVPAMNLARTARNRWRADRRTPA
jgi:glycosyltransferase involved in cell wall biosynthesis